MSRFPRTLAALTCLAMVAPMPGHAQDDQQSPSGAETGQLGLGRPATPAEIAAWDIDVRPDGQGLPLGQGDVLTGEEIFTETCSGCHGDFGEGVGRFPALAGGFDTLTDERPVKTVGSYWPYLSTVFDYVRRAQPFGSPGTLDDDDVYALTAYILYLNDEVDEDFVLTRDNFAQFRLPNEAGFSDDDRASETQGGKLCLSDCRDTPEITRRARDLGIE